MRLHLVRRGEAGAWFGSWSYDARRVETERRAIESLVAGGVDVRTAHRLDLMAAHGRLLFDILLPDEVKAHLREAAPGELAIGSHRLDVPWPLLHDGKGFLGCRWALGELVARTPHDADPPRDGAGDRALLIGDPAGDLPGARLEAEELWAALGAPVASCLATPGAGRRRRNDCSTPGTPATA